MKDKYRKALKNYTSKASAANMLAAIQQILVDFGANGVGFSYEQGRVEGVHFKITTKMGEQIVNLPLRLDKVAQVLKNQNHYRDEDHVYRVALANVRDWLDAQMAILATEMVEFPEIFLPYMADKDGRTLYEIMKDRNFALPGPSEL